MSRYRGSLMAVAVAVVFFVVCVVVVTHVKADDKPLATPSLSQMEKDVLTQINAERAKRDLSPLVADPVLTQSARMHCVWMSRNGFRHSSASCENIACGQQTSVSVMSSWMSSAGHRANILSRTAGAVGVAAYRAVDGTMYWVQQFRPRSVMRSTERETVKSVETTTTVQKGGCENGACHTLRVKARRIRR